MLKRDKVEREKRMESDKRVRKVGNFYEIDATVFASPEEVAEWMKTGKLPEPK